MPLGDTHGLLQADCQVNHRHVGGGDTEGHASQLAGNTDKFQIKFTGFLEASVYVIGGMCLWAPTR